MDSYSLKAMSELKFDEPEHLAPRAISNMRLGCHLACALGRDCKSRGMETWGGSIAFPPQRFHPEHFQTEEMRE